MSTPPSLRRLVVVPRNGYANRLQAWASAAALAADTGAALDVLWQPEPAAAAAASDLFAPAVADALLPPDWFTSHFGVRQEEYPRYLTVDREHDAVVLAGHDRGEQAYMAQIARLLDDPTAPTTLVIIAGGRFSLRDEATAASRRGDFYRALAWSDAVEARLRSAVSGHGAFAALHVRQTDRSRQAPTPRSIRAALTRVHARLPGAELFIAADSDDGRRRWMGEATQLGFTPWTMPDVDHDRGNVEGGVDALAEWRVLAQADVLVHPAASTFSAEAAVASGHPGTAIGIAAPVLLQQGRALVDVGRSVITYPRRHGWLGQPADGP